MTCKDCVHYDVCQYDGELCDNPDMCEFFKPKSRFVELPCKVGQTVYVVSPTYPLRNSIYECTIAQVTIERIKGEVVFGFLCYGGMCFDSMDIGKTVFPSREEAELALKERGRE